MTKLINKKCLPCESGSTPLPADRIRKLVSDLPGWRANDVETEIYKKFEFNNFYRTMSFVNAVAWVANGENHHPILEVSYDYCIVRYSTHAVNGLTENDFICASKIDELIQLIS